MKFFFPLLCALLVASALSCNKDKTDPAFDRNAMRDCYGRGGTDSLTVARSLVGKWVFRFSRCDSSVAGNTPVRDLQVEFKADGTLAVYEDGRPVQSSPWQLENAGGTDVKEYRLLLNTRIRRVAGLIYVCGDHVMFSESTPAVCDITYRRVR